MPRTLPKEIASAIMDMWFEGYPAWYIATQLHKGRDAVRSYIEMHKYSYNRTRIPKKEFYKNTYENIMNKNRSYHDLVVKMRKEGATLKAIAKVLGYHPNYLCGYARKLNIEFNSKKKRIIVLLADGKSPGEIAEQLSTNVDYIYKVRREYRNANAKHIEKTS